MKKKPATPKVAQKTVAKVKKPTAGDIKITAEMFLKPLSGGRVVKVGVAFDEAGKRIGMAMQFDNAGDVTRLMLTDEAFDAMASLAKTARRHHRTKAFTFNLIWRVAEMSMAMKDPLK